jgi:hypothetical protein
MWLLLQHKVTREAAVKIIQATYNEKADKVASGTTYAKKVADNIHSGTTITINNSDGSTSTYTQPAEKVVLLSEQLKKLSDGASNYELTSEGKAAYPVPPPPMFNVEYLLGMAAANPGVLTAVAGQADSIKIKASLESFKFNDSFTDLSSFDLSAGTGDIASVLASLNSQFDQKLKDHFKEDQKYWVKTSGTANASFPFYVTKDKAELEFKDLQFHIPKVPILSSLDGGTGTLPPSATEGAAAEDAPIPFPKVFIRPGDTMFGGGAPKGVGHFHFAAADFGLDPQTVTDAVVDSAKAQQLANGYPPSSSQGFANDKQAFEDFRTAWDARSEEFEKVISDGTASASMKEDPTGNVGQIKNLKSFLKLSSVDPFSPDGDAEYDLSKQKALMFIQKRINIHRACYRFPTPSHFQIYAARQKSKEDDPFYISGMFFIDAKGSEVVIPAKYEGMGMIATDGKISVKDGCTKTDPAKCGNLILIAEQEITLGGTQVDASIIGNGSVKCADNSAGQLVINGNLVVGDTSYKRDGTQMTEVFTDVGGDVVAPTEDTVKAFHIGANNQLPNIKIVHDQNLTDYSEKFEMFVISPYRIAQSSKRPTAAERLGW